MIKKSLQSNKLFILVAFAALFFVTSCSQNVENQRLEVEDFEVMEDMMVFDSFEDYKDELQKVLAMTFYERKTYEQGKGYKSFGRACEEVYYGVSIEDFTSKKEIEAFVEANKEYLEFVIDEEGEVSVETVCDNDTDKYFENKDQMFTVGNTVVKSLSSAKVHGSMEYIDLIMAINDDSKDAFKEDSRIFISENTTTRYALQKSTPVGCNEMLELTGTNGNERLRFELTAGYAQGTEPQLAPGGGIMYVPFIVPKADVFVKSQRKAVVFWWNVERTMELDLFAQVNYSYYGYPNSSVLDHYEKKHGFNIDHTFFGEFDYDYYNYDFYYPYIAAVDSWADNLSVDPIYLNCNADDLNK